MARLAKAVEQRRKEAKSTVSKSPEAARFLQRAWKWITVLATLLGFLALLQLIPSISIEPLQSLDIKDPFAQRFTVTNKNIYAIDDVHFMCRIRDVEGLFKMANIGWVTKVVEHIEAGAEDTLSCELAPPGVFRMLQITPELIYRLPFGFHGCQSFPMVGEEGPDGTYIWEHSSSDSKACGKRNWIRKRLNLDSADDSVWGPLMVLH